MQKKLIFVLIILFTVSVNYAEDDEGISIYKIWGVGDNPDSSEIYLDPSTPVIYVGLVNNDPYQRNVRVTASYEGNNFESTILPLSPNTHYEKIVEIRLEFNEVGEHDVDITLIDENGKEVDSEQITVNVVSPIDIKNVTCQTSYVSGSTPNIEIVNSNWFTVTLESNYRAQTDYEVKTWISVVSTDYDGDTNEDIENEDIYYNGRDDLKVVYVPYRSEQEVSFKIPEIKVGEDEFKIQVHTNVMGLHDYTNDLEKTELVKTTGTISYNYKQTVKTFQLPIHIASYSVFNDINGSNSEMVKTYYRTSKIYDKTIEDALNQNPGSKNVLSRAYVEDDPYLSFLKINLENRYDSAQTVTISCKSFSEDISEKTFNIGEKEAKAVYVPLLLKVSDEGEFNLSYYSNKYLVYESEEEIDLEPKIISPVQIYNISYPVDSSAALASSNSGCVFVGKNYTMNVTLKNNYNRTLTGKLYVGDHYDEDNSYESGVFETTEPITFKLSPKEKNTYSIDLKFNREVNGLIEVVVDTNGAAVDEDDDIAGYSTMVHFDAYNILDIRKVWYNNTILPKIATINKNGGLFLNYPLAGFNNSCAVSFESMVSDDITYKMWVEVYDSNGNLKATSNKKNVLVKAKSTNGNLQTADFDIFFEEGFIGYTLFHAVPLNDFEDVDIFYTEGSGTVSKDINPLAPVGRYSSIDLLSSIPTSTNKVTEVVAPIKIDDMAYTENNLNVVISSGLSSIYPVNLTYFYRITISNNNKIIYKSPTYKDIIHSTESKPLKIKLGDVDGETYDIVFEVEIPDFAREYGTYHSMILKKYLTIANNQEIITEEENSESETYVEPKTNVENTEENSDLENQSTTADENRGIIGNILDTISSIASNIPIIRNFV
ncbi:hypothetical protein HNP87_000004 [Methanococcus maripaludis]|uniref:Uncharacterized protein n=1 Tax=Methanococcus maripaludis TaxID=39152 RepID=A0A7J9NKD9_METMI|nr:hypothetical protein [Methanococcus maripaludis]MBA2839492.1 hypothetical protein [Methanococcus maripaludis]